jgi:hypothetical protein
MLLTLVADLPAPPSYEVRTPRRGDRFAAQVWCDRGFWSLGLYSSRLEARRAAQAFAASGPIPPAPGTPRAQLPANWLWRRSDRNRSAYRWVRRVKGNATQCRPFLGAGGSLNLGLFTLAEHPDDPGKPMGEMAEWAAAQVAKAFAREWKSGRTVGEVVELLKNAPKLSERVPAHVVVPPHQRDLKPPTNYTQQRAPEQWLTLLDFAALDRARHSLPASPVGSNRAASPVRPSPAPALLSP